MVQILRATLDTPQKKSRNSWISNIPEKSSIIFVVIQDIKLAAIIRKW